MCRHKPPKTTFWWKLTAIVPAALIDIPRALVTIVTLGHVNPSWTLRFLLWRNLYRHRHVSREENIVEDIDDDTTVEPSGSEPTS